MSQLTTTILLTAKAKEQPPQAERRASERCRCSRRPAARLVAKPIGQPCRAAVRDVSEQGMGLITPRPFAPGTIVAIEVVGADTDFSDILTAEVRHATQQPDGSWVIGCLLSKRLTKFQLFSLL